MMRIFSLFLALGLACGIAFAQAPDSPASKEDVEKLFTTMHVREQMRTLMDAMSKQSRQMAQENLRKRIPQVSQKDLDRLDAMMDQMQKGFDVDGMIEDMVPIYQRHLTKEDVSAMEAFYQTPTGQKMLREQPAMTTEAMRAVQPRMEKMMNSMMEQAEKMAKEPAAPSNSVKD